MTPTHGQCHNPSPSEEKEEKRLPTKLRMLGMGICFIAYDLAEMLWRGLATWGSGVSPSAAQDEGE
jgi:hypothetical protein